MNDKVDGKRRSAADKRSRRKRHDRRRSEESPESLGLPLPETARLAMLAPDLALITFQIVDAALPSALTEAEQDIALRVYLGQSNQQIARARQTSVSTIGNQLEAIYRKLAVSSRSELVLRLRGQAS